MKREKLGAGYYCFSGTTTIGDRVVPIFADAWKNDIEGLWYYTLRVDGRLLSPRQASTLGGAAKQIEAALSTGFAS